MRAEEMKAQYRISEATSFEAEHFLNIHCTPFADMRRFMELCGDELPHLRKTTGEIPQQALRYLTLCDEELSELHDAFDLPARNLGEVVNRLDNIADGAIDLIYVAMGILHSLGLPAEECWHAVHSSNLSKRQPDGTAHRRLDGKILKPISFRAPDIKTVIINSLRHGGPF